VANHAAAAAPAACAGTPHGDVTGLIHAAGVSPSQASPATILAVDLYGTTVVLEEFGNVIVRGGAGVETKIRALGYTPKSLNGAVPLRHPNRLGRQPWPP
jgi:hypothetical protein